MSDVLATNLMLTELLCFSQIFYTSTYDGNVLYS